MRNFEQESQNSEYNSYLASNLKYLRKSSKYSQEDFGKRFDKTRDNIASYERENDKNAEPKLDFLIRVAHEFGITVDDLLKSDLKSQKSEARSLAATKDHMNFLLNKQSVEFQKLKADFDKINQEKDSIRLELEACLKKQESKEAMIDTLRKQLDIMQSVFEQKESQRSRTKSPAGTAGV